MTRPLGRLALAGITGLTGAIVGLTALAAPAFADVTPIPVRLALLPAGSVVVHRVDAGTTEDARKKKKDPCTGDAALDSESGKWRATVSCDDWTAVLPGTYKSREDALAVSQPFAEDLSPKVVAGPGCDDPMILC